MFEALKKRIGTRAKGALEARALEAVYSRQKAAAEATKAKILANRPQNRVDDATRSKIVQYSGDVFGTPAHAHWLEAYATHRGTFIEGWLPQSFLFAELLAHWPEHGRLRARTMQGRLLKTDAFPDVMVRYNGYWLTPEGEQVPAEAVAGHAFAKSDEVIVKTDRSHQGSGTTRHNRGNFDVARLPDEDLVIQRYVAPHPVLAALMPDNAPTIRLVTVKPPGRRAEMRSGLIKIGRSGDAIMQALRATRVGILDDNGTLASEGFDDMWRPISAAPDTGASFADLKIPAYREAAALCMRLHDTCPASPLVGWDLTIGEDGKPWIFEWNMGPVGITYHEADHGPCFEGLHYTAKGISEGLA